MKKMVLLVFVIGFIANAQFEVRTPDWELKGEIKPLTVDPLPSGEKTDSLPKLKSISEEGLEDS